jgi:hypothetical protein
VHGGERPARLVNLKATEVGRDALAGGGPEEVLEVGQVRVVLEDDGVEERTAAAFGPVPADEGVSAKALLYTPVPETTKLLSATTKKRMRSRSSEEKACARILGEALAERTRSIEHY